MTDGPGLQRALHALGVECTVEMRDRLAVLASSFPPAAFVNDAVRARAVELARAHGFTHIALECDAVAAASADLHRA